MFSQQKHIRITFKLQYENYVLHDIVVICYRKKIYIPNALCYVRIHYTYGYTKKVHKVACCTTLL